MHGPRHHRRPRRNKGRNDEIRIKTEEFCIKTEELCIKNEELCTKNDEPTATKADVVYSPGDDVGPLIGDEVQFILSRPNVR